jgi:hypothetical protein
MTIREERRVHPRARVKVRVELDDPGGGRSVVLHTHDLSEGGARCRGLSRGAPGTLLRGRLYLPLSEGGRDVDVPVPFEGLCLRRSACGAEIAIAFTHVGEADRDELRRYLLDWMADDCPSHATLAGVG